MASFVWPIFWIASFSADHFARSRRRGLAVLRELLLDLLEPLLRLLRLLLRERALLDLERHDPPLDLVDLGRHRVDLRPQARGRLVDEVDGLVGQEPVGDVAVREAGGGDERARP